MSLKDDDEEAINASRRRWKRADRCIESFGFKRRDLTR